MKRHHRGLRGGTPWTGALVALGVVGACTVVDKGDYTFTDNPEGTGGASGSNGKGGTAGSSSGNAGKGGISGDAGDGGDGSGAVGGTAGGKGGSGGKGGTGGTSAGDAGAGGSGGLCDPNPCLHGGRCTDDGVKATCECADGYEGTTCETNIDECDPNPCQHQATCQDLVADYKCDCPPQDAGKNCDLPRFEPVLAPDPMVGMGVPPPPGFARSVSADGKLVVGQYVGALNNTRPFAWSHDTGSAPLPTPTALRDVFYRPAAQSGDGLKWAGSYSAAANGPYQPLGGKATDSQTFALPTNATAGEALDLDRTGAKAVGYFIDGMGGSRACVWTDAVTLPMLLMNPNGMGLDARAGGINRDGTIITGAAKDSSGNFLVVSWVDAGTNGPPTRRITMPGIVGVEVRGISADGQVAVGMMKDNAAAEFAFSTQNSQVVNISPMIGAVFANAHAWDVSDDGKIIVGDAQAMSGSTLPEAGIWETQDVQNPVWVYRNLLTYMRDHNVQLPQNWQLIRAYGVSADGKIIVGEATDPMGMQSGFIVRLP